MHSYSWELEFFKRGSMERTFCILDSTHTIDLDVYAYIQTHCILVLFRDSITSSIWGNHRNSELSALQRTGRITDSQVHASLRP